MLLGSSFFLFAGFCVYFLLNFATSPGNAQYFLRTLLFPWITGPPSLPALRQPTHLDHLKLSIKQIDAAGRPDLHDSNSIVPENLTIPEERSVRFFLYPDYEKKNYSEEIIPWNEGTLANSHYNPTLPLIMIIHGFYSDNESFQRESAVLRNAYLDVKYPANIIGVDWGPLVNRNTRNPTLLSSAFLYYFDKVPDVVSIATPPVSDLIIFLTQSRVLNGPEQVHIVGFSIGAQLAGMVGLDIKKRIGRKIGRISGLDPAGPLFNGQGEDERLSSDDADFVDVTHTNQALYGYLGNAGHVDWYINGGGPAQPGQCQHSRAFYYFADSIRNVKYFGCGCNSRQCQKPDHGKCHEQLYGYYADQRLRGSFYVGILNNPRTYFNVNAR